MANESNELIINTKIDIDYADAEKQLKELNKKIDQAVKDREVKIKIADEESGETSSDGNSTDVQKVREDLLEAIKESNKLIEELNEQAKELAKLLTSREGVERVPENSQTNPGKPENAKETAERERSSFRLRRRDEVRPEDVERQGNGFLARIGEGVSNFTRTAVGSVKKLVTGIGKAASGFVKVALHPFRSVMKMFGGMFSKFIPGFARPVQGLTGTVSSLVKRLLALASLGAILNKFIGYLKQVLHWNPQFRQAMADLKGALYTLAQPFIEFIIPIVIKMVQVLTRLVRTLADLAAKAFGKSLAQMAANARDLYNTVQAINKTIASYDELNVINRDDTIYPDFSHVTEGLMEFLDPFTLGKLIAKKINEAIAKIPWAEIGATIGKVFDYLTKLFYTVLTETDFGALGSGFATLINSLFENYDTEYLGRLVVAILTVIPDTIIGFFTTLDFGLIATKISDFFIGLFDEASKWLDKYDWEKLGSDLAQKIKDFITNIKWDEIANKLFTFLGKLFRAILLFLKGLLGGVWEDIKKWWKEDVQGNDWKETVSNLLSEIIDGIGDISKWVMDNIVDPFMSALMGEGKWTDLKENIANHLDEIITIGLPLALVVGLVLLFFGHWILGLGLILAAIGLLSSESVGGSWENLKAKVSEHLGSILLIGAALLFVVGLVFTLFGHFIIGLGLILAGIGAVAYTMLSDVNWDWLKEKLQGTLGDIILGISAGFLVIGLVLLLTGVGVAIGIALILVGLAGVAVTISAKWDYLKEQLQGKLGAIVSGISALFIVIGIVLLLTGVGIPIGITLIIAGFSGLAVTAVANWDSLKTKISGAIDDILAIGGALFFVIGGLLCITGVGIPLGLGLIAAGVAMGIGSMQVTEAEPDWDYAKNQILSQSGEIAEGVTSDINDMQKATDEYLGTDGHHGVQGSFETAASNIEGTAEETTQKIKKKSETLKKTSEETNKSISSDAAGSKEAIVGYLTDADKKSETTYSNISGYSETASTEIGYDAEAMQNSLYTQMGLIDENGNKTFSNIKGYGEEAFGTENGIQFVVEDASKGMINTFTGADGVEKTISNSFSAVEKSAGEAMGTNDSSGIRKDVVGLKGFVSRMSYDMRDVVNGRIDEIATHLSNTIGDYQTANSMTGKLVTFRDRVESVFSTSTNSIKNVITGAFNSIDSSMSGLINSLINKFNHLIRGVNGTLPNLAATVNSLNSATGSTSTASFSTIQQIPALAFGAVVPPNRQFLAMLGDNKSETEVVSPLSTMKQALVEAMQEYGGGNNQPIILQVSGKTLAQLVWDEESKRYKQYGRYSPSY